MRQRLVDAIENCRVLVGALDDPAREHVSKALLLLDGARDDWPDTDDKVLRTWIRYARDDLEAALKVLDGRKDK